MEISNLSDAEFKTLVEAVLGLHHPENPRASTPSGQLHSTPEHHYPAPAELMLHGWYTWVVSGQPHKTQEHNHAEHNPTEQHEKKRIQKMR